ncbi:hypothetical protein [Hyalangium rubrum]|uniref:Lipoprotein n=1 Tax=Hyalangium rubrum TaxID=3103134 RepID=A0ABU5GXH7_9BACT|nr:hypothetical protein [Hyalangium sp. s54d21]MDY7225888.1 hypothetical protein [Hyalangium sp. s54d21]
MQPEVKKKQSPWLYIGIGCGSLLLIGAIIVGVGVWFVAKKANEIKEDMANPIVRTEKVKKALGAKTLPDGYYAMMSLSVPMVMDTAMISTKDPDAPHDGGASVFMYFFLKSATSRDVGNLRDYLEGKSDDASVISRAGLDTEGNEVLGRGVLEYDGRRLLYLTQRGELRGNNSDRERGPTLNTLVFFECPGSSNVRMGVWLEPDPSPETPTSELDLQGTTVDPEAVRPFMAHFNPCQES